MEVNWVRILITYLKNKILSNLILKVNLSDNRGVHNIRLVTLYS